MTRTLFRYTLLVASCAVLVGCATQAAKPAKEPLPEVTPVIDAYVAHEEVGCSWGLARECYFTGVAYKLGMGAPQDLKRSLTYFQKACSLGLVDGCVMVGVVTVKLGGRTQFPDILATWERACEDGSYAGCNAAGQTLVRDPEGLGTPRDMERGRMYLRKACAARYLPACGMEAALVIHLKEMSGYPAARAKLVEVCELRERESCHYLAQCELDGTFGARDGGAAGRYFFRACDEDWGPSCSSLAYMHAKGIATPVNPEKAKRLYSRACALKHQPACDVLEHPDRPLPPP